ncbi:MAG TPA: APC family permease [Acidobacteriota bacterium]|nr:APC family permease [Acidobacteriota bacterium]
MQARDLAAERTHEVDARSTVFRKELGFFDLALTQILYIVGSGWVGTAAKLGDSHIVFWLSAILLYYLPQAAVVIYLNRLMPIEGGLYQWARVGMGEFAGFLTAWNLWAYTVVIIAMFGVMIANNISYLLGPAFEIITHNWWYTAIVSALTISAITTVSLLGLRTSKWLQNVGGIAHLLTFGALIIVPIVAMRRGMLSSYHPLATSMPSFTPFSLNIFGKMALGALSGFEYVAILAGECKSPARTIARSVLVASPIIALMFILGTSSVLAMVPNAKIDLVSPIPQTLTIGFQGLALARFIVPILILLLLLRQIGNVTYIFAGNTRLPLVAGWDGLLPRWFTHVHPRLRTPTHSILFVGGLTLVLSLAGQIGVGVQEAFQLLENSGGILYAFTYLALFAIPIVAAKRLNWKPPFWLRAAAISGFAVSLLYSVLSVFPIIDVASWQVFTVKIVSVLISVQLIGILIYVHFKRRLPQKIQG